MLGAVLFNMFMNDLVYLIKNCDLSTYDDDTQIFAAETEPVKLQEVINTDLAAIDRWYDANGMKRNHLKYQALVMGNLQTPKPKFHCDNTTIPVSEDLTLLGVSIDNKQKFDKQIANVTRKVSQHLAVWETFYLLIWRKTFTNHLLPPILTTVLTCGISTPKPHLID